MFSRQRLFWHRGPYDLPSTDQLFLQATADCCAFHMARCPQYRAIAEHLGFSPTSCAPWTTWSGAHASPPCSSSATPSSPCPGGGW